MTHWHSSSWCFPRKLPCQWLTLLAVLALCGNASRGQEPNDLGQEEIALNALEKNYKLKKYQKNPDGWVVDVRLEDHPRFDDKAIDHVVQFKRLHSLSVRGSSITDAGFEKMQSLKHLKRLWMGYTEITDRGLGYLEKIPSLRQIWAWNADKVTEKGLDSLRRAVPDLAINLGSQKNLEPFKFDPLYKEEMN